jgi:hypothetical protein
VSEPVPELPAELPPGEEVLLQVRPPWRRFAQDVFHLRALTVYFLLFAAARGLRGWQMGGAIAALRDTAEVLPLVAAGLGVLAFLGWVYARATLYVITTGRIVIRSGVAVPMTFNLPFRRLGSADVRARADGSGDIVIKLAGKERLAWLALWPNARPWRFAHAEPMLRGLPNAAQVAEVLAGAMRTWSAAAQAPVVFAPAHGSAGGDIAAPPPHLAADH